MNAHPVSVVIPVYNGAAYIDQSIASVVAQTLEDWLLFVVDNRSTDATPRLAQKWAKKDSRIQLVRCDNFVGALENHERGFRIAAPHATYCKVVQADDLLFPDCLRSMVRLGEQSPSVGVVSAYRVNGDTVDLRELEPSSSTFSGAEILRRSLLRQISVTGSPTSLLIRSDLILKREPFWDCSFWHADKEAPYWCLTQSDFGIVHRVLTLTRRQRGTRMEWSDLVNTTDPENVRLLLRYGPSVLSPSGFRKRLRRDLAQLLEYHVRQRLRPSRRKDEAFQRFHHRALGSLLSEANDQAEVRLTLALIRPLLNADFAET